jgi:hypothetical protein
MAAAAANVSAPGAAPFLDRSVHYDKLTPEMAQRLEAQAREVAQQSLLTVNSAALALLDGQEVPSSASHRVNLGVYVYVEDEVSSPQDRL